MFRIERFIDKLIHTTQDAFIKNRNIMNGVVTLHEILHDTKRNGKPYYSSVGFLFVLIKIKGFSNTWGNRVKQVVKGGTVCVVNLMTALNVILVAKRG